MAPRVLILGGSFGGLTTAYELRRLLSEAQAEITLISKEPKLTFIPSLPWVALGSRSLEQLSFDLAAPLARRRVRFLHESAVNVDLQRKVVTTEQAQHEFDLLVVATGHRSANEAVGGLGPFDGPGHSLMSPPEAEELRDALQRLLADPGPVVIGAAPGASCIGPAYEFLFELDHLLRRRKLRHAVPITFVTPEPHLGHMGIGKVGKLRQFLEGELEQRDIGYRTSAAITKITTADVEIDGAATVPSALSMVIPPLAGVQAIAASDGLSNPKGFVPVDAHYRHADVDGVYAVGVAVAMAPAEETPVPVNFPKTGHMTEQMATIAADAIAATITGADGKTHPLAARCILDMGDRAAYLSVDPVRPPRDKIPTVSQGRHWLLAKRLFERAYLWHARRGRRVPTALGW
jgi:sulfide:quinone oxidoreductase